VIRLKLYLLEIAYRELLEETSMQKEIYDVIVVGAGIVGCSTSYHLARSGLKVALVDKGSGLLWLMRKGRYRMEHILLKGVPSDGLVVGDSELLG
jgi:ribulose 1,5-bisphosphate synthetase/thiazole synthase